MVINMRASRVALPDLAGAAERLHVNVVDTRRAVFTADAAKDVNGVYADDKTTTTRQA